MTQVWTGKYNATNTNDFIDKIKDTAVSAGWTLHDTIASPYGYVLYSDGEDDDEMTCYIYIWGNTDKVSFQMYTYWNNSTHTGAFYIGNATYSRVLSDDDASFDCYVSANASCICAISYTTYWQHCMVGLVDPWSNDANGTLASGVSSGSSVTITLGSGEAETFVVGNEYQIADNSGGGREVCAVTAVTPGSNQITVDSLSYSYSADARIGNWPFKWQLYQSQYQYGYNLRWTLEGTSNDTSNATCYASWIGGSFMDPDNRAGGSDMYGLLTPWFADQAGFTFGFADPDFLYASLDINSSDSEHTVSLNEQESGTSSGSNTSTTLNDTSQSWTTDEWIGKILMITAGTGVGQFREITDNDSTSLTVATWTTTPDGTSEYVIADEAWMFFYFNNNASYCGAIRALVATA